MNNSENYVTFMKTIFGFALLCCVAHAHATYYTSTPNNDYTISTDNGVVYISHPQFVSPCTYGRVEIRDSAPYSAEYAKRMTAAIFLAKALGKNVAFVWDDSTAPTCLLSSVSISN